MVGECESWAGLLGVLLVFRLPLMGVEMVTLDGVRWRVWVKQTAWQECRIGGAGLHCTDCVMCRL